MNCMVTLHGRVRRKMCMVGLAFTLFPLAASAQYSVEYFWDKDPGVGKAVTLTASDQVSFRDSLGISVEGLPLGVHKLGLRALNRTQDTILWSETHYRNFLIPTADESIRRIEYFWDKDPGKGQGTSFTVTPSQTGIDFTDTISTEGLAEGVHRIWFRACSDSVWSAFDSRLVYVAPVPHALQALEYFWDIDPGVGNGTKLSASTGEADSLRMSFDLYTEDLQEGVHRLGLRALTDGTWSETQTRLFLIRKVYEDQIGRVEYFWDTDPGLGMGKPLHITPAGEIDLDTYINVMYLSGKHTMYLRAQSGTGDWSENYEAGEIEVIGDFSDHHFDDTYSLLDKQDCYENSDEAALYNKVEYHRTFSNTNWQSLYVPFCASYEEWMGDFEIARLNAVHQYDEDGDGDIDHVELEAIKMKKGIIEANTPYLIKSRTIGEKTLTAAEDPALYLAEENSFDCSSMNARFVFTGTYHQISGSAMMEDGLYALTGGKLSRASSAEASLGAFRWYLRIENRSTARISPESVNVKVMNDDLEDESTGIQRVNTKPGNTTGSDAAIIGYYTLDGTALSKPQKGVVIVKYSDGRARKMLVR